MALSSNSKAMNGIYFDLALIVIYGMRCVGNRRANLVGSIQFLFNSIQLATKR